jgi:hypothetical protein
MMKRFKLITLTLFSLALLLPAVTSAHHSHANLDRNDIRIYTGVVNEYRWAMPHVYLKIMAPNSKGEVVEHAVELLHPPAMTERGWLKDTFKSGDRITWEGSRDKNPNRYFTGLIWVEKEDGARYDMKRGEAENPLVPSNDFTGLWKRSSSFGSTYGPPPGLPLTEAGQIMVDNFDPSTNPQVVCEEPGPPRFTVLPYPIQITRRDEKTFVFTGELRSNPRVIHLDRDHPPGPPTNLGHSVGWFEDDELVVDTTNFSPDRWGNRAGLDSSDQKHLIERYSLADNGMRLKVFMTLTDPVYLTETHEIDYSMDKQTDRQLVSAPCSLEGAALFLTGHDQ